MESESSEEASEQSDEAIAEKPGELEEIPTSCDSETPKRVRCNNDVTKMSFSDDDMDMNVDFDLGMESGDDNDCYADLGGEPDDDGNDEDDHRGASEERMDSDTAGSPETRMQGGTVGQRKPAAFEGSGGPVAQTGQLELLKWFMEEHLDLISRLDSLLDLRLLQVLRVVQQRPWWE